MNKKIVDAMYKIIVAKLEEHVQSKQFHMVSCIHGDPVFSNILIDDKGHCHFIDMRGILDGQCTTSGDLLYDLSKVYQSVLGYDEIILDLDQSEGFDMNIEAYHEELKASYWEFVKSNYPHINHDMIPYLTAAHYFCIVPLHINPVHQKKFLQYAKMVLGM